MAEWREEEHPRDERGRFTEKPDAPEAAHEPDDAGEPESAWEAENFAAFRDEFYQRAERVGIDKNVVRSVLRDLVRYVEQRVSPRETLAGEYAEDRDHLEIQNGEAAGVPRIPSAPPEQVERFVGDVSALVQHELLDPNMGALSAQGVARDYETGHVVHPNGEEMRTFEGEESRVQIDVPQGWQGGMVIHNHPSGLPLSPEDVAVSAMYGLRGVMATTVSPETGEEIAFCAEVPPNVLRTDAQRRFFVACHDLFRDVLAKGLLSRAANDRRTASYLDRASDYEIGLLITEAATLLLGKMFGVKYWRTPVNRVREAMAKSVARRVAARQTAAA